MDSRRFGFPSVVQVHYTFSTKYNKVPNKILRNKLPTPEVLTRLLQLKLLILPTFMYVGVYEWEQIGIYIYKMISLQIRTSM